MIIKKLVFFVFLIPGLVNADVPEIKGNAISSLATDPKCKNCTQEMLEEIRKRRIEIATELGIDLRSLDKPHQKGISRKVAKSISKTTPAEQIRPRRTAEEKKLWHESRRVYHEKLFRERRKKEKTTQIEKGKDGSSHELSAGTKSLLEKRKARLGQTQEKIGNDAIDKTKILLKSDFVKDKPKTRKSFKKSRKSRRQYILERAQKTKARKVRKKKGVRSKDNLSRERALKRRNQLAEEAAEPKGDSGKK